MAGHARLVQFTLSEKLSNPEKVESRRAGNAVSAQSAPGQAVGGAAGEGSSGAGESQALGGVESVLKRVDDYLGGKT